MSVQARTGWDTMDPLPILMATTLVLLVVFGSAVAFLAVRALYREGKPSNFKVQGLPPLGRRDANGLAGEGHPDRDA
jgi:hypothetical protein